MAPIVFYPTGDPVFSVAHWQALERMFAPQMAGKMHTAGDVMLVNRQWWAAPFFALTYFASMFLATFSNVAFYHEIMQALNGNAVSIRRGFQFAVARWRAVLLWSLFAGLVGYVINTIEQRVGFLGKIICGFIGMAWSVSCIFIIPTLVRDKETENPVKLLRQSAGTLKRTWGELIVGLVGLELGILLFFAILILGLFGVAGMTGFFHVHLPRLLGLWVFGGGFVLVVLLAMVVSWLSSVVNPVYRCALYIYATEGVVPDSFDQELLDSAWKVK